MSSAKRKYRGRRRARAASTWAFVNDGEWEERARRVLRLVMDGLRYKAR